MQVRTAATVAFGTQLALGELPIPFISAGPLAKQMATKLEKGTISNVSNATLGKIMTAGAPGDFAGNYASNYVQTQVNKVNLNNFNLGTARSISIALSIGIPSLSTTIALANVAISLAHNVIASHSSNR